MRKIICLGQLVVTLFLFENSSAQPSVLEGVWLLDLDHSIELMEASTKAHFTSLATEIQAKAKSVMTGRKFQFDDSGKFTAIWKSADQSLESTGHWVIDSTAQELRITIDHQTQRFAYEIDSLGRLTLQNKNSTGFFRILSFNRQ